MFSNKNDIAMKKLFVILFLGLLLQSCGTIKMEKDQSKASPSIVYSKGPCFGKCPIFTMTIYNTGLVKFNGRRYTKMDGKHERQLDKATYVKLVKAFQEKRFWRFDDSYGMDLVDAATVTISFSDKDKTKTVKGKSNFPDQLKELALILDELLDDKDAWHMVGKPIKVVEKNVEVIENQIIIKIGNGMILSKWLQDYKKYGVRLMKRVGKDNNLWLIRYDKSIINPNDMLKMVQDDEYILNAEFNTRVSNR